MSGRDDISVIVGRRMAPDKFDLIVAGYREDLHHLNGRASHFHVTPGAALHDVDFPPGQDELITKISLNLDIGSDSVEKDALVLAYAAQKALQLSGHLVERNGAWKMHTARGRRRHGTNTSPRRSRSRAIRSPPDSPQAATADGHPRSTRPLTSAVTRSNTASTSASTGAD
ncbi:hypothetical protein [Actinoplanes sp. NPDC048796]|uniref:hypothetical protein n=1 Tax=Actinoplanes sp. NPDC048796 TaxID=3155640 RepID=UPI0033F2E2A2